MANANAHKKVSGGWDNELKTYKLTYDFAEDGGATGTITLGTVAGKFLCLQGIVHVETACTSGGSATVKIGPTTADDDAFLDITSGAVASLTDDATVIESTAAGLVIGDGDTIDMVIGTAALTAGKINVYLSGYQTA